MIYNELQSIYNGNYNDMQSITIHLQSIYDYNELQWIIIHLQSIYNGDYNDIQSIPIHLQWRLQWITTIYNPFTMVITMNYNELQSIYNGNYNE